MFMRLPAAAQSEAMAAFGGSGSSLTGFVVDRPDEEVMLFALRLDQTTLNDTFPGFPVKDGCIVPLGELCRQLDLAIQVDPTRGLAEGFFIEERRHFRLDVLAGTVVVNGEAQSLDRSLIELHADDIYVDTRLIARWLPLDLQLDKRSATLTVLPREPLPLQLRWKRERESGRAFSEVRTPQKFDRVEAPYRLLDIPFVDETLRVTARSEQGGGPRLQAQSSTYATGDLLYLSTSVYAILDNHDGLSEFRATADILYHRLEIEG